MTTPKTACRARSARGRNAFPETEVDSEVAPGNSNAGKVNRVSRVQQKMRDAGKIRRNFPRPFCQQRSNEQFSRNPTRGRVRRSQFEVLSTIRIKHRLEPLGAKYSALSAGYVDLRTKNADDGWR